MGETILIGFITAIILLLLYFLFWPVKPRPVGVFEAPPAPELSGVYEPNDRLQAVSRFGDRQVLDPEAVTADSQGRLYTGTVDGRIVRLEAATGEATLFAETGGRPLGMAFDARGNLVVADRHKGLLSISPDGIVSTLTTEAEDRPVRYANDLAIAADGTIYFSDYQYHYYEDVTLDIVDGQPQTRLLAYDPGTESTRVLLDNLYAANGVALGPDDAYVLVCEFLAYRVTRLWLTGARQGQTDFFVENLPGLPDNITWNGRDIFWLALISQRSGPLEMLQAKPFLRALMRRLPDFLQPPAELARYGFVLGLDTGGRVVHNLQDPSGEYAALLTSAFEHRGTLYLGGLEDNAIKTLPLADVVGQDG